MNSTSDYSVLDGVRVVEISSYAFAATAGTVLADWGADVIRVIRPDVPEPLLRNPVAGMDERDAELAYMWEITNRGKRVIELDSTTAEGAAAFARLIRSADVFLTNVLPRVRRKLGISVEDLRSINPALIYARATATGPAGPERDAGGFDTSSFWARSGLAYASASVSGEHAQPGIAIGDLASGVNLAGGVAGALFRRLRTGEPSVVDVSLLATGVWIAGPHVVASSIYGVDMLPIAPHARSLNPLVAVYRTADDRMLSIASGAGDAGWQALCAAADRPDLASDLRFVETAERRKHNEDCVAVLDTLFRARPISDWLDRLRASALLATEVRPPSAVVTDPQVQANGYAGRITLPSGREYTVVTTPVQFDERILRPSIAPRPGQHTAEVLAELGYTTAEIEDLVLTRKGIGERDD